MIIIKVSSVCHGIHLVKKPPLFFLGCHMEYEEKERALSALCPHCLKTFFFFLFLLITLRTRSKHNPNKKKKKKTSLSPFSSFFLRWFFFLLSSAERFYEQGRVVAAVRLVGNSYGFAPRLAYNQNTHTHTHAHFVIVVKEGKTRPQGCHLPTTSQQERGRLFVEVSVRYTSLIQASIRTSIDAQKRRGDTN